MKLWILISSMIVLASCQTDPDKGTKEEATTEQKETREEPMPEGMRNKRGYPIGTVEQAEQLMAGAKAKRREIARRNADLIKNPKYGNVIKSSSQKMDVIRPKMDHLDGVTEQIVAGERVDFLSDEDLGKIQYRQQTLLDALIDSLSYLNSQLDQVLMETDTILMKKE